MSLSLLKIIPNDVILIINRYVHRFKFEQLNEEYIHVYQIWWRDLNNHNGSFISPVYANFRPLEKPEIVISDDYVYNVISKMFGPTGDICLPKNY